MPPCRTTINFRPLLGAAIIAAFTFVIITFAVVFHKSPFVLRTAVVLLLVLGLLAMGVIRKHMADQYEFSKGPSHHHGVHLDKDITPGIDYHLSQYAHILAIYVFGTVSIAANLMYALTDGYCLVRINLTSAENLSSMLTTSFGHSFGHSLEKHTSQNATNPYNLGDQMSRVLITCFQVAFFSCSMPFLCRMSSICTRPKNKAHWAHNFIPLVISSSLGVWLYTYLRETKLIESRNDTTVAIPNLEEACLKHKTVVDVFDSSLDPIAYPFLMELSIAGLEELLRVWFLPVSEHVADPSEHVADPSEHVADPPEHVADPSEHVADPSEHVADQLSCWQKCPKFVSQNWAKILHMFNMNTALFFGIVEVTVMKFFIMNAEYHEKVHTYMNPNTLELGFEIPAILIRICFQLFPSLVVTVQCYQIAQTFTDNRENTGKLSTTDIIIVLSVCCMAILSLFDVIIGCMKFDYVGKPANVAIVLTIVECLLRFPQFVLLALLIHKLQTKQSNTSHYLNKKIKKEDDTKLQGMIEYLAMYSFCRWFINSFLEADFKIERAGTNEWKDMKPVLSIIVHLCLPLVIYFRYIATFLLIDVKYLLKNDDAVRSRTYRDDDDDDAAVRSRTNQDNEMQNDTEPTAGTSWDTGTNAGRNRTRETGGSEDKKALLDHEDPNRG